MVNKSNKNQISAPATTLLFQAPELSFVPPSFTDSEDDRASAGRNSRSERGNSKKRNVGRRGRHEESSSKNNGEADSQVDLFNEGDFDSDTVRGTGKSGKNGKGKGSATWRAEDTEAAGAKQEKNVGKAEKASKSTRASKSVQTDKSNKSEDLDNAGAGRKRTATENTTETAADGVDRDDVQANTEDEENSTRRRRRRRTRERDSARDGERDVMEEVSAPKGSTRLEAKRQRRREGRREGRKRHSITESEFLARRESVDRKMLVREENGLNQIAVLEDGLLVEHYVASRSQNSMVGSIFMGRVQNVLPSMEAAFVDLGRGRNAVLYAGEVNWDSLGMGGKPRRIEQALKAGDQVMVQVTKDPIGHKGARLTSQVTLAGRYLVLVPGGSMLGISRKLPDKERLRLKKLLGGLIPKDTGVIVRTAAEGASEEQLEADVNRLTRAWAEVQKKASSGKSAPQLLRSEPELALRVVRDIFNEDFHSLQVQGKAAYTSVRDYVEEFAPDLLDRTEHWVQTSDIFEVNRVDEQLTKGMDRKVWLPSGGYLIIDRTEAMTVIDVNTGKFVGGDGGTLEETVTRNNLEAAEEIVRQLRLRDIGGIIVIDFVDMVLEDNRELVLRRLIECLSRDRTRHQVTEVTALGLVQMTRKRVGQGLVEAFSTVCECCEGRGFIVHQHPIEKGETNASAEKKDRRARRAKAEAKVDVKAEVKAAKQVKAKVEAIGETTEAHREDEKNKETLAAIAQAAATKHEEVIKREKRGAKAAVGNEDDAPTSTTFPEAAAEQPKDSEKSTKSDKSTKVRTTAKRGKTNAGEKRTRKAADSEGKKKRSKLTAKEQSAEQPQVVAQQAAPPTKRPRRRAVSVAAPVVESGSSSVIIR
ncbi:MAG: Rne/Rng family ribonuclease [Actinomycetaceae bacterium]|nr:Rne/Rng family ribonuclease [Actinomycetaceae bacterium]